MACVCYQHNSSTRFCCYVVHKPTVLSSRLVCYLPAVLKIEICHFKGRKKMSSILSWKQDTASFLICTANLSCCSQGCCEGFSVIWELRQLGRMTVMLDDKEMRRKQSNCSLSHTRLFLQISPLVPPFCRAQSLRIRKKHCKGVYQHPLPKAMYRSHTGPTSHETPSHQISHLIWITPLLRTSTRKWRTQGAQQKGHQMPS